MPAGKAANGDTKVQFHVDQIRILVVHETQLAVFDASKMECIRQVCMRSSLEIHIYKHNNGNAMSYIPEF